MLDKFKEIRKNKIILVAILLAGGLILGLSSYAYSKGTDNFNVKIIFFKSEDACLYCKEVKDILLEVSGLSDKISLEEYDIDKDKEKVKQYSIKRTPGIVIKGEKDYGVRFYGIPAGHEFMTLIHGIMNVSAKNTGLSEKTIEKLKEIIKPYNIQVFVTPT